MTIRAVVYDFHRTLALPPGGTIWRRALLAALAEHREDTDGEELGRVLNASFPWETPEERLMGTTDILRQLANLAEDRKAA